jgi:hypothetical protein
MIDHGYFWSDTPERFPRYRVSWDEDSKELFTHNCSTGEQEVLAKIHRRSDLDDVMAEWPDLMYQPRSLEELRRRISLRADELAGVEA